MVPVLLVKQLQVVYEIAQKIILMASVWEHSSTRRVSGHFIHDGSRRLDTFPSSQNEAAITKFRLNREDRFYERKRYCTFYI